MGVVVVYHRYVCDDWSSLSCFVRVRFLLSAEACYLSICTGLDTTCLIKEDAYNT